MDRVGFYSTKERFFKFRSAFVKHPAMLEFEKIETVVKSLSNLLHKEITFFGDSVFDSLDEDERAIYFLVANSSLNLQACTCLKNPKQYPSKVSLVTIALEKSLFAQYLMQHPEISPSDFLKDSKSNIRKVLNKKKEIKKLHSILKKKLFIMILKLF